MQNPPQQMASIDNAHIAPAVNGVQPVSAPSSRSLLASAIHKPGTLTIERLQNDLSKLTGNIYNIVQTVIKACKVLPRSDICLDEICWWYMDIDGKLELFRECYLLCKSRRSYLTLAPEDVQVRVAFLDESSQLVREAAPKMAAAIAYLEAWNWEVALKFGDPSDKLGLTPDLTVLEISIIDLHSESILNPPSGDKKRKLSSLAETGNFMEYNSVVDTDRSGSPYTSVEGEPAKGAPCAKRLRLSSNYNLDNIHPMRRGDYRRRNEARPSFNTPKKQGVQRGKRCTTWPAARVQMYLDEPRFGRADIPVKAFDYDFYHEFESNSTPSPVDPRLIDFDISIEEILTYLSQHTTYHEITWRIMKSWEPAMVVKFIFWVRDLKIKSSYARSALHYRKDEAEIWARVRERTKTVNGVKTVVSTPDDRRSPVANPPSRRHFSQISYSSGRMGADAVDPFDYPIYALADGVHQDRHPTGKGAQLLTRVIKHILHVSYDRKVKLSEIHDYAEAWNITVPDADRLQVDIEAEDADAIQRYDRKGTVENIHAYYSLRFGRMG